MISGSDVFFQVIDFAPGAVLISDFEDHILFANKKARAWFGDFLDEKKMPDIFKSKKQKWQNLKADLLSEQSASFDLSDWIKNIPFVNIYASSITYRDKPCIAVYMRDISEQNFLAQELTNEKNTREHILNSIPALVFVKDDENRIISMNTAFQEVTGLTMDKVYGKNMIHITENKELAENTWKDDLEVIETGLPKRNIIEPLITDKKKWYITDKIPYRDKNGKVIGVIGFSIDITERKNAEDALMRSERKTRLIFETSPDGIVISNFKGEFISTNQAFRNLLGYTYDELARLGFRDITPQHYATGEMDFNDEAINSDNISKTIEKEYIAKNNELVPVSVTCWMLKDEAGKPIQMVANIKDLTFQKKAEALEKSLVQKEKEQLEQDLEAKTQQLNFKITQLIEKNQLVANLIRQLQNVMQEQPNEMPKQIESIIQDLENNSLEDFWSQFETTFGQINQSFYDNLYKAYPNLTPNERKISAFLKMNLSTKDIANITHQSIRSIEMARARLRAKLKLDRKENLSRFLNQF